MYNLLAIGDIVIDTQVQLPEKSDQCCISEENHSKLCFEYGGKIPIVDSFQSLGGNAANVAVGVRKLGLESAVVTTVGDDVNGAMAIEQLKRYKVDTSFITREHGAKTRYSIVLNFHGERTILSYSEKKNYIWPEPVPATEWVYYTGMSEGYEMFHERLLAHLAEHPSVKLAYNPGSYMLHHEPTLVRALVARTDVLIVNLQEAESLADHTKREEKTEAALIHDLLELGAKEVALTDGARGAWAGNKDEIWHLDAYPVKVVSKTGAGDAFSAGYLTARHHSHDLPHALQWGIVNSSGAIGGHGPQAGLLDMRGMEKMLEKFAEVQPIPVK